ncbi:MAG: 50S ribosomal protein L6 [Bacteroidetes bacterium]|jgi:large subunit ribosomal protein L6|nr:50S ribosomal protein L6 [Bacteroidota bacterium]MBT4410052.1 50S ribosomal protein L6 [Bacteroidota bacterium]MBT7463276.1 50S ribosomal protein L6 [Bacteroidota bacterium]
MSRIGKLPISIPEGVSITVQDDNTVVVKGPLGELSQKVALGIEMTTENGRFILKRMKDDKKDRSEHGLYRSLVNNMVIGVSKGYEIKQELVGVGYKATTKGQLLELSLGFSHPIYLELPPEVKIEALTERRSNPIITLKSIDKQLIGQVAAKIRSFRPPEPYKGKGVKFVGEVIRRKAGKAAAAK